MIYAKYLDIPNWEQLQQELIDFYNTTPLPDLDCECWQCWFPEDIKKYTPTIYKTFEDLNLQIRQMIVFTNTPNDLNIHDHTNSKSLFIHTDNKDEYEWEETVFEPTIAINIPMINCNESETIFYEKINDSKDVFYSEFYKCGGIAHDAVKEVFRFKLDKPAILRINVPHAVYNPTNDLRIVATFRFYGDLEHLIKD
jgi:hypothetical protein